MNVERLLADCQCGECADCQLASLTAENARLRAALEEVRDYPIPYGYESPETHYMQLIAEQALKGPQ